MPLFNNSKCKGQENVKDKVACDFQMHIIVTYFNLFLFVWFLLSSPIVIVNALGSRTYTPAEAI